MPTCRICLRTFKSLRFETEHIGICTRCVNTLNDSPEPAKNAEARFAEKLARGMQRNAERDLKSDKEWKRRKAQQTLDNLDAAVDANLHDWITKLLGDPSNSTRDFKIMRAYRRGLLRMEGFADYRDDWKEAAQRVRRRDGFKCMACGTTDTTLDVHHIIYLSHQGTNQQNNLITLCRTCHEDEHDRVFDWPEPNDPESTAPIQPQHHGQTLATEQTQTERIFEPTSAPAPVSVDQLSGGFDHELMMDGSIIAGAYIESGIRSFSQYATMMIEDFGDGVMPYLLSFWEAIRRYPGLDAEGMTDPVESEHLHQELLALQGAPSIAREVPDQSCSEWADAEEITSAQRQEPHTMKDIRYLSESRISRELGEALSKRLVNACIRDLQRMGSEMLLSGDSSGLRNTWDEICVQQQREYSCFWRTYLMTIEACIDAHLEDLQLFELDALWLKTNEYDDWECELEGERDAYPVNRCHVLKYLQNEVLNEANNWSNERISRYLKRGYDRD